MLKTDETGKTLLTFENTAVIRRIPLEKRGTSRRGLEWTLGGCLVEVYEDEQNGSAQLYLITFEPELIEQINIIGVGKKVNIRYHIDTRERFDGYSVSVILDDIEMLTDGENFLLGKERK